MGKTHLIAALWHATDGPAAYLTFAELTALIGFEGMDAAVAAFADHRLICLDEFELDDVANTLMTVTFLRRVLAGGALRVATTSNSLPDRLGEGRFSAEDFRREIAAIAEHFDVVRIDGPDVRATRTVLRETVDAGRGRPGRRRGRPGDGGGRRLRRPRWPTSATSTPSSTAPW